MLVCLCVVVVVDEDEDNDDDCSDSSSKFLLRFFTLVDDDAPLSPLVALSCSSLLEVSLSFVPVAVMVVVEEDDDDDDDDLELVLLDIFAPFAVRIAAWIPAHHSSASSAEEQMTSRLLSGPMTVKQQSESTPRSPPLALFR